MSDNQILYISSIICFLLIIVSFRFNRPFGMINLIGYILYNLFLYCNFFYENEGGSGFLWWFYLIILTALQIVVLGIYIGIKFFKRQAG